MIPGAIMEKNINLGGISSHAVLQDTQHCEPSTNLPLILLCLIVAANFFDHVIEWWVDIIPFNGNYQLANLVFYSSPVIIIFMLIFQSWLWPIIAATLVSVVYISGIITTIAIKQTNIFPYDLLYLFEHTSVLSMALGILSPTTKFKVSQFRDYFLAACLLSVVPLLRIRLSDELVFHPKWRLIRISPLILFLLLVGLFFILRSARP